MTNSPDIEDALVAHIKAKLDERVKEYDAKCEDWAWLGWPTEYCFHGVLLCTVYDPICGWCEDGDDWRDTHTKSVKFANEALLALDLLFVATEEAYDKAISMYVQDALSLDQFKSIGMTLRAGYKKREQEILWGTTKKALEDLVRGIGSDGLADWERELIEL
jgi:hypothetical protein